MRYSGIIDRIDRMDSRQTTGVLVVLLLASIFVDGSSTAILQTAVKGIECACRSLSGFTYDLHINEEPAGSQVCSIKEFDTCECTNTNGEVITVKIPQLAWGDDSSDLAVDLYCSPSRNKRSVESEGDEVSEEDSEEEPTEETEESDESHDETSDAAVNGEEEEEEEISEAETAAPKLRRRRSTNQVETKSNILSRTIKGTGSVMSGVGNTIGSGINAVGTLAGDSISGTFHLVGKATKKITELTANTINTVGGVFESSKETVTKERQKRSIVDAVESVPAITSVEDMKEAAAAIESFKVLENVKDIFNNNDDLMEAKRDLKEYAEADDNHDNKLIYMMYHDSIKQEHIQYINNELDIVMISDKCNKTEGGGRNLTNWNKVVRFAENFADSKNEYEFINKVPKSNLGKFENKLYSELRTKAQDDLSCGSLNRDTLMADGTTVMEVISWLTNRREICEETDQLDEVLLKLQTVAPARHRRSLVAAAKAGKPAKTTKAKAAKKTKAKKATPLKKKKATSTKPVAGDTEQDSGEQEPPTKCVCDPDTDAAL